MSDKKLKELDVKLHNFIFYQQNVNTDMVGHMNQLVIYHVNRMLKEKKDTPVCVSAFM